MSRILCLDLGERRTGVAISDETHTIAQSLTTINHRSEEELITAVRQLIKTYQVTLVVIGLPLSLSGKPSTRSEKIRIFARRLEKKIYPIPINLFDERLTTDAARQIYTEVHGRPFRRHLPGQKHPDSPLDRIAATIILENYLARNREPQ